jgi:hypothetical protein
MQRREGYYRSCIERRRQIYPWALALVVMLAGCSRQARVRVGQDVRFGPYTLRVTSVEAYTREHQGVPFEVEIRVRCEGGNQFERRDFTDDLSKGAKIYFSTAQGWRERGWLLARGYDYRDFLIQVNPPPQSTGMMLEIGNPNPGAEEPDKLVIDLGR